MFIPSLSKRLVVLISVPQPFSQCHTDSFKKKIVFHSTNHGLLAGSLRQCSYRQSRQPGHHLF